MSYLHSFASVYDTFTEAVGYSERADYICSLLSLCGITSGDLLDVACGTGSLSLEFLKKGFEVTAADISPDMLNIARDKLSVYGEKVLLLCQDMRELDLFGTVDCTICSLDSINHLLSENDVEQAVKRIALFTRPGGAFIFDINTLYKHRRILSDRSFVYEDEDTFLVWQNSECDSSGKIDIMLDIFSLNEYGDYVRESEDFSERAYETDFFVSCLEKYGFKVKGIYSDMSFDNAKEDDDRVYFAAIKN